MKTREKLLYLPAPKNLLCLPAPNFLSLTIFLEEIRKYKLNNYSDVEDVKCIYNTINDYIKKLESIGTDRGYLPHLDITNSSVFPLISNFVSDLINYEYNLGSLDDEDKRKEIQRRKENPHEFIKEIILKDSKLVAYFYQ